MKVINRLGILTESHFPHQNSLGHTGWWRGSADLTLTDLWPLYLNFVWVGLISSKHLSITFWWSLYVRILCGLLSCDISPICKKCWSLSLDTLTLLMTIRKALWTMRLRLWDFFTPKIFFFYTIIILDTCEPLLKFERVYMFKIVSFTLNKYCKFS